MQNHDSPITWMQLLYLRVTGQFDRIDTRPKTSASEARLGLKRSAYFYVDRPHPDYGEIIVAHSAPTDVAHGCWAVSPFDTGGWATGKVLTVKPIRDQPQVVSFLQTWSWSDSVYESHFETWIDQAFEDFEGYVRDERPAHHVVPEIDVDRCDSQSWTWEGRLEALGFTENPMPPYKVLVPPSRKQHYLDWLREERLLVGDAYVTHLQMISRVLVEVESPVEAVQRAIVEGGWDVST